jgi:hypothetical protein
VGNKKERLHSMCYKWSTYPCCLNIYKVSLAVLSYVHPIHSTALRWRLSILDWFFWLLKKRLPHGLKYQAPVTSDMVLHPGRMKTSTAQQNKPKNLQNMTCDINYCGIHIFYGRRPDIYCSNILGMNGESSRTRSWMICTPHPILCGW